MTINLRKLSRAVALLFSLVIASACEPSKPAPSGKPGKSNHVATEGELTAKSRSCLDSRESIGKTKIDFDRDGEPETDVDLFEIDFKYPIVARWRTGEEAGAEIWAVATHLIVTLRPNMSPKQAKKAFSSRLDGRDLQVVPLSIPRTYLVGLMSALPDDETFGRQGGLLKALPDLRTINSVEAVEPDYIFTLDKKPNDLHFGLQDDFSTIRAPEAWNDQTGNRGIRVAVIDSGIDANHIDLKDNLGTIWKDFVNGQPQPYDDNGHGTQCSGLIGAKGDNQIGIAGINWDVEILPIKAFDINGCGAGSHAAEAIHFAVDNGADVISASWGGFTGKDAKLIKKAIERADKEEILFVASAGNKSIDLDKHDYVPGTLQLSNLISVSAVMDDDTLRKDSGFGKKRVHLSAPGEGVLSTFLTTGSTASDPYAVIEQTSAATALVAGACALVMAEHSSLNHHQIRRLILDSTKKIKAGASCSGGRLDLANAIQGNDKVNPNSC